MMTTIDLYVQDVLSHLAVSDEDRARIEADLRSHLRESVAAGLTERDAVERMGPPEDVAAELSATLKPAHVPYGRRVGAMVFDLALIFGVGALFAFSVFSVGFRQMETVPAGDGFPWPMAMFPAAGLLLTLLPLAYFTLSEWLTGRTLGKWLFGTRVADEGGQPVKFGSALVRRLPILFMPLFFIDAAVVLVTEKRQRASELLAHTRVLSVSPRPPAALAWAGVVAAAAVLVVVIGSFFMAVRGG
jgi:uncharacterized RDD family membrane protein YckC